VLSRFLASGPAVRAAESHLEVSRFFATTASVRPPDAARYEDHRSSSRWLQTLCALRLREPDPTMRDL